VKNLLLVLMGESGSGKDTILNQLIEHHNFKRVVTYTTRPKRPLEVNGVDYHFVSEKQFKNELLDKKVLLEHNVFNDWHYGFTLDGLDYENENYVLIITPSGFATLRKTLGEKNITSIYLDVHERERIIRLAQRGDDIDELMRRVKADRIDFSGIKNLVDITIKDDNLDRVVKKIEQFIKGSETARETKTEGESR
jgi:guanylate kinase